MTAAPRGARPRPADAGFGLVGAVASLTIMLTLMAMAMPAWRYVMQDDREEELIFRGSAIADALARWQRENKTLPGSFDVLVTKKYLRKAYTDPMSKHGRWRFIHPGDVLPPPLPTGATGAGARGRGGKEDPEEGQFRLAGGRDGSQSAGGGTSGGLGRPSTSGFGSGGSLATGPILGVASTSKAKSLRLFNGRSHYNEWIFTVGMPRIVGKMPLTIPAPGSGPGAGAPPRPVGSAPKR